MKTKFKHNDTVVLTHSPSVVGELVDIVVKGVFDRNNRPITIYKYKMWVRYTDRFMLVNETEIDLYND